MIKGKVKFLLFFGALALLHYIFSLYISRPYFNQNIILIYTVLILLSFIGNTLIHLGVKQKEDTAFSSMFMVFTTIQLLVAMSFSAYLIYGGFEHAKALVLQFVLLFFLGLLYQCIYFIRLAKSNNQQKNV